jgi:hypothetical protein
MARMHLQRLLPRTTSSGEEGESLAALKLQEVQRLVKGALLGAAVAFGVQRLNGADGVEL